MGYPVGGPQGGGGGGAGSVNNYGVPDPAWCWCSVHLHFIKNPTWVVLALISRDRT